MASDVSLPGSLPPDLPDRPRARRMRRRTTVLGAGLHVVDEGDGGNVYTTCRSGELEAQTSAGWQLYAVLQETLTRMVSEFIPNPEWPHPHNEYDHNGELVAVPAGHALSQREAHTKEPLYLLRMDDSSALAKAHRAAREVGYEREQAEQAAEKAVEERNAATKKLAEVDAARIAAIQNANAQVQELERLRQSSRRLEEDLARCRRHFGEQGMREALKRT